MRIHFRLEQQQRKVEFVNDELKKTLLLGAIKKFSIDFLTFLNFKQV